MLLTIGYERRPVEDLVATLLAAGARTVADVRLTPSSRKPGYSRRRLSEALPAAGLRYVHLPALGNPRDNRAAFHAGRPEALERFHAQLATPVAAEALRSVLLLAAEGPVALLCLEHEPDRCHRRLIAEHLHALDPALGVEHL
ncbi:MAG TPA: DUF488 domain-containing protein [Pseudonocardiaceae bacterium]